MSVSRMYTAFCEVELGTTVHEVWQHTADNRTVDILLTVLGEKLGINLSESAEWFAEPTNPFDDDDVISEELTANQFQRRIGNYLLYLHYEEAPPEGQDVDDFIREKRQQLLVPPQLPEQAHPPSKSSSEQALLELFAELPLAKPVLAEQPEQPLAESIEQGLAENAITDQLPIEQTPAEEISETRVTSTLEKSTPKKKQKTSPKASLPTPQKLPSIDALSKNSSWLEPLITAHMTEIQTSLATHLPTEDSVLDLAQAKHCFQTVLRLCRVSASEKQEKAFYSLVDAQSAPLSANAFIRLLNDWAQQSEDAREVLPNRVELTLQHFKSLDNEGHLNKQIEDLNSKLQSFAQKLHTKATRQSKIDLQAAQQQGLAEIFSFYARAVKTSRPTATFEEIESDNTTWTLSKFLKFCTDFKLLDNETPLTKARLTQIFKERASNGRFMSQTQLTEALDRIADAFYCKEYDQLHKTSFANKPVLDKRQMLYQRLHLDQPRRYTKRMKGFGPAFSNEESRIPQSEIKYQFRLSPQRQRELDSWRQLRKQRSQPVTKPIRQDSRPAKREGVLGYSSRNKRRSPSSFHIPSSNQKVQRPVTFKDLERMTVFDLDRRQELDKDTERFFSDLLGNQQSGLRLQQRRYERGMEVAAKNRLAFFKFS